MSRLSLAFQLSASATGMSQGINAGVVELQKLGLEAKRTARDVSTLKTLEISRAFIGGIQAIGSAISRANSLLSGFVEESVGISESVLRSSVIFGRSADAVREFASASAEIGISENAALKATSRFGTLFKTIGLGENQAAEYSQTLVALAADLASFSDTSVDDAITAISSALVGEFEPIRRYGVLLNEATLKQTAFANGFRVTGRTLDPQTKLLASYSQIIKQTATQQGDFERTSGSLANQQRILAAEWNNVRAALGSSLQPVFAEITKQLRSALPEIRNFGLELASFVGQIDVRSVFSAVTSAIEDVASAFAFAARAAAPLASNILPAIGGYLAFINRQAISAGLASLRGLFLAAGTAASAYASGALTAAAATAALGVSVRAFLVSTGIGALPVILGLVAGGLVEWASSARSSGDQTAAAADNGAAGMQRFIDKTQQANLAVVGLGDEIKNSLKVPDLSVQDFAQDSLNEARSAIVSLAKELGGLEKIPTDVRTRFEEIARFAGTITEETLNETQALRLVDQDARALTDTVGKLADANKRQADAAKEAADAARKSAEEARQRTATLAAEGLPAAESARLQLNKDLLAIQQEQRAAEQALADARAAQDSKAVADAKARLGLIQQARDAAFEQNRERQRQALGVDESIIKPAQSIADQFKNLRTAFTQQAIDPEQFQIGIRNLAEEGIRIRREIAADLSRPANRALQAADIRTQEGAAQFAALASGREDPAIAQRREQLAKLEEIRRGLLSINIRPVEILGG